MIWGLKVEPAAFYEFIPSGELHLTSATLDTKLKAKHPDMQLWYRVNTIDQLIAAFSKQMPHVSLNLKVSAGEKVTFFVRGNGTVYANGYIFGGESSEMIREDHVDELDSDRTETNIEAELRIQDGDNSEEINISQQEIPPKTTDEADLLRDLTSKTSMCDGVIIQELQAGIGEKLAEKGVKVGIYYEAREESSQEIIMSVMSGEPFSFELGSPDVNPGWNIGLVNMKVNEIRRITCPPHAAYGASGIPCLVPPNATLVFIVHLINIE